MKCLRPVFACVALLLFVWIPPSVAQILDLGKYPNLTGQWRRAPVPGAVGQPPHDPAKPPGRGQGAPLTAEYQAIFEANIRDQAAGGHGMDTTHVCTPNGMPRAMSAYEPFEIIITQDITYILIDHLEHTRRIYTDGRAWPSAAESTFVGYSIGRWVDEDADGRFDVLEIETRHFKGPRVYDSTGIPLHADNQSVIKERLYVDRNDRNLLRDEITTIDNALTRPWTVTKNYRRGPDPKPIWHEYICPEGNSHVRVGTEDYFISGDGFLMPTKKDQAAPDARYFKK
ncbi:MAG TPA: hypothetical protein VK148_19040 [Xanthobacteraceae bacterium]|nr:hypothetical protein [Xanthobacteraceae bacterium]